VRTKTEGRRKLAAEAVALGLGYAAVLIWGGTCLVASFGPSLASPYWPVIPHLRTDTTGVIAFAVAAVSLVVSRYLQLRRRGAGTGQPASGWSRSGRPAAGAAGLVTVQAVAETAAVLCTGVVAYLSLNAVTHPDTLRLQLTHLWPWPSEGTVRVIALGICLVAVAVRRYLRAMADRVPGPVAAVPESAGRPSGQMAS
jgi:hypothetical protein